MCTEATRGTIDEVARYGDKTVQALGHGHSAATSGGLSMCSKAVYLGVCISCSRRVCSIYRRYFYVNILSPLCFLLAAPQTQYTRTNHNITLSYSGTTLVQTLGLAMWAARHRFKLSLCTSGLR